MLPPQLHHGVPCGLCRLRLDEIDDRLRRRQVHPAVEEGPLGELPPARLPDPGGEEGPEPLSQHHRGAVAVELGAVLPGVAVAGGEGHRQTPVDDLPPLVQESAQDHLPPGVVRQLPPVQRAEHPVGGGQGLGPRHPEDPDGGDLVSCGDGGNGVHSLLPFFASSIGNR